jgi:signal peptidase I
MNFALIMFVLLIATGAIWLLDRYVLSRRRDPQAPEPWWIEYPKSFFPVILIVFLLRSFLVEPFKIPSGSMMPTLLVGDFILVNKFTYGIRVPIINTKVINVHEPRRGEVVVFRYPDDPSLDYIKRVVGVPGDKEVPDDQRRAGEVRAGRQLQLHRERVELHFDGALSGGAGRTSARDPDPVRHTDGAAGGRHVIRISRPLQLRRFRIHLHRTARALLHDGRQPRQQQRQPLLGIRAGPEHRGPGIPDLVELRRTEADRPYHRLREA